MTIDLSQITLEQGLDMLQSDVQSFCKQAFLPLPKFTPDQQQTMALGGLLGGGLGGLYGYLSGDEEPESGKSNRGSRALGYGLAGAGLGAGGSHFIREMIRNQSAPQSPVRSEAALPAGLSAAAKKNLRPFVSPDGKFLGTSAESTNFLRNANQEGSLANLVQKFRAATTDAEKNELRSQINQLYYDIGNSAKADDAASLGTASAALGGVAGAGWGAIRGALAPRVDTRLLSELTDKANSTVTGKTPSLFADALAARSTAENAVKGLRAAVAEALKNNDPGLAAQLRAQLAAADLDLADKSKAFTNVASEAAKGTLNSQPRLNMPQPNWASRAGFSVERWDPATAKHMRSIDLRLGPGTAEQAKVRPRFANVGRGLAGGVGGGLLGVGLSQLASHGLGAASGDHMYYSALRSVPGFENYSPRANSQYAANELYRLLDLSGGGQAQ